MNFDALGWHYIENRICLNLTFKIEIGAVGTWNYECKQRKIWSWKDHHILIRGECYFFNYSHLNITDTAVQTQLFEQVNILPPQMGVDGSLVSGMQDGKELEQEQVLFLVVRDQNMKKVTECSRTNQFKSS